MDIETIVATFVSALAGTALGSAVTLVAWRLDKRQKQREAFDVALAKLVAANADWLVPERAIEVARDELLKNGATCKEMYSGTDKSLLTEALNKHELQFVAVVQLHAAAFTRRHRKMTTQIVDCGRVHESSAWWYQSRPRFAALLNDALTSWTIDQQTASIDRRRYFKQEWESHGGQGRWRQFVHAWEATRGRKQTPFTRFEKELDEVMNLITRTNDSGRELCDKRRKDRE
ncbi:hypothetical protein [Demequina salsinemoris]|uniref:hypothetical protein n=1 Tax=Demequina salsinemoris TaxID=577470 RepID=UPI000780402F|nr:hypothetical protein [Demequina salsinemoris]